MTKRYDLKQAHSYGEGKTYWQDIGSMFQNDKGGFSLKFNALPIPTQDRDGTMSIRVMAFEPRPKDQAAPQAAPAKDDGFADDIPW